MIIQKTLMAHDLVNDEHLSDNLTFLYFKIQKTPRYQYSSITKDKVGNIFAERVKPNRPLKKIMPNDVIICFYKDLTPKQERVLAERSFDDRLDFLKSLSPINNKTLAFKMEGALP